MLSYAVQYPIFSTLLSIEWLLSKAHVHVHAGFKRTCRQPCDVSSNFAICIVALEELDGLWENFDHLLVFPVVLGLKLNIKVVEKARNTGRTFSFNDR